MLPLWRDRISVELSPHSVAWVRLARGLRPSVTAKSQEAVLPQAGEPLWQAALVKLQQIMLGGEWKNAEVTVVLSNHFVRYDCLPWNAELKDEEEQLALASHRLTNIYGAAVQKWTLCLSPSGKGESRLVAAVESTLLELLKQAMTEAGIKLHSIQPYLMTSFNRYAKSMARSDGWFVAAEAGRFTLALFRDGQWRRVLLRRGGDLATLHEWLERENLASGEEASCREVFLFGAESHKESALPSYRLHRLELSDCQGYSSKTDPQYSIAMSGVA